MTDFLLGQDSGLNVQLSLLGMPPPTNLFIGYRVNPTRTAVSGVYIVCINGAEFEWDPILVPETVETLPATLSTPSPAAHRSGRVHVRK
jgi:hypothetical protein